MAGRMISIDRLKLSDEHYRYKMPEVVVKVEGKGNGIKTVFPNIPAVCSKLKRPPQILNKFFGYELGAQSTYFAKESKYQVMGSFTQGQIQDKVFEFIDKFVLCRHCRNPETIMMLSRDGRLQLSCQACQQFSPISASDKTYAQFKALLEQEKGQPEPAPQEADVPPPAPQPSDENTTHVQELLATATESSKVNFVEVFASFLAQHDSPSAVADAHAYAYDMKSQHNLQDEKVVALVIRAITYHCDKAIITPVQRHSQLLKKICGTTTSLKRELTKEIADVCVKRDISAERVPMVWKVLFEEGVLTDDDFRIWQQEAEKRVATTKITPKITFYQESLKTSAPFLQWLRGEPIRV